MSRNPAPRVSAELGRPETPAEAQDRTAMSSAQRRRAQTPIALLVATGASLLIVLFLVVVVVRPDAQPRDAVDVSVAAESVGSPIPLAVPEVPEHWAANDARWAPRAGLPTWNIGYVIPGENDTETYLAVRQGVGGDDRWAEEILEREPVTGTATVAGITWQVVDRTDQADTGNRPYGMYAEIAGDTVVIYGTASQADAHLLAEAVVASLTEGATP